MKKQSAGAVAKKRYSNKKLEELINSELIWPRKSSVYRKLLNDSLISNGYDPSKLEEPGSTSDLIHEELWWDVCEIVNDLAQMVLDEREKREEFIKSIRQELKHSLSQLTLKNFK